MYGSGWHDAYRLNALGKTWITWDHGRPPEAGYTECFSRLFFCLPFLLGISTPVLCQSLSAQDDNGSSSAVHVNHCVTCNEIMKRVAYFIYLLVFLHLRERPLGLLAIFRDNKEIARGVQFLFRFNFWSYFHLLLLCRHQAQCLDTISGRIRLRSMCPSRHIPLRLPGNQKMDGGCVAIHKWGRFRTMNISIYLQWDINAFQISNWGPLWPHTVG